MAVCAQACECVVVTELHAIATRQAAPARFDHELRDGRARPAGVARRRACARRRVVPDVTS
jgi:hypothetical protein